MSRFVLFGLATLMIGCAYLMPQKTERDATTTRQPVDRADSVDLGDMPYDPLSLGPDIFAELVPRTGIGSAEPESPVSSGYRVQLGAFIDEALARDLATRAESELGESVYVVYDRPFHRVRVGNCSSIEAAESLKSRALGAGFSDARIAADKIEPGGP